MANDKAYQRKVVIVSAAVIFALMLIIALIANLVQLGSQNKRAEKLAAEIAYYNEQIAQNKSEIEYRKTPEYIADYAREQLEMKKSEEEALKGK